MSDGAQNDRLTVLQRLDIATAERLANQLARRLEEDLADSKSEATVWEPTDVERRDFVRGLLGIRGFRIHSDDVEKILEDRVERYRPEHQEWRLVRGLARAFDDLLEEAMQGRGPSGWAIAERFRSMTDGLARFRNNTLRRDIPWDSIPGVPYPDAQRVGALLDGLHEDANYGDQHPDYEEMHPVRQAARLFWRFARISPFPDFNVVMAVLAASHLLCSRGYPAWVAQSDDRARLDALVKGALPERSLFLEQRLLDTVQRKVWAPNPGR
ncbi:MAG: Fic family protein [Planctomycetota bacterium]